MIKRQKPGLPQSLGLALIIGTGALSGCGGGQEAAEAFAGSKTEVATKLSGEVRSSSGVLRQGKITVEDFKGQPVSSAEWNDSPKFSVSLPAGTLYPVVLTAHSSDGGGHQMFKVVVTSPTTQDQIITASTTAIAARAKEMGGYTPDNITAAAMEDVKPQAESGGHH